MSAPSRLGLVALGVALGLVGAAAGCNGTTDVALWRDDFESACEGAPCGWVQIAGPRGSATWIETVPGEHGVQLVGAGVAISRIAGDDSVIFPARVSSLQAHVVARCDPGSQLTLIVTVHDQATGMPLDASGSATFPSTWDGNRSLFDLFAADATARNATFDDIVSVVVHKDGEGTCEVDYVSLADEVTPFFE